VPALAKVGVKQMINGPESFTPDGNFILGQAPECANMFVGAGFNAFGIASGGGAGWVLADWVARRARPPWTLWTVDIRRFAAMHADRDWVCDRTLEAYGKHYTIGYPHEEYESGRPRIVSPLYERLKAKAGASAPSSAGSARTGLQGPDRSRATNTPWVGRTGSPMQARSTGRCANAPDCSTSPPSPNMK
jgi:sarcosine dehydrogenase